MAAPDPAAVAAEGRAAAEAMMTDTCRIERVAAVQTSADGEDTRSVTVVYEGKCRIKPAATASVNPSPTTPSQTWQYKISIPYADGAEIRSNDRVTITASADATLPATGRHLQVRNLDRGTHITARRFWCTEVSR